VVEKQFDSITALANGSNRRYALAHSAYMGVTRVFPDATVTGGLAVSLLCQNSNRQFDDLDLVINQSPVNKFPTKKNPGSEGEFFFLNESYIEKYSLKLGYSNKKFCDVPFDVHILYTGELNLSGLLINEDTMKEIKINTSDYFGTVKKHHMFDYTPIEDIIDTRKTVKIGEMKFEVIDPVLLAVMKYTSYRYTRRDKKKVLDKKDLELLLRSGNSRDEVAAFVNDFCTMANKHERYTFDRFDAEKLFRELHLSYQDLNAQQLDLIDSRLPIRPEKTFGERLSTVLDFVGIRI
jgi:hypothetical protein